MRWKCAWRVLLFPHHAAGSRISLSAGFGVDPCVNVKLVIRDLRPADIHLHASLLSGVLQLLVFGVRNLIANSEQKIDRRRI